MEELSDASLSTVDDFYQHGIATRPDDKYPSRRSAKRDEKGWGSVEQMERGDEYDSYDKMRRTMRCCVAVGVVMAALVVFACVMLYDNIDMGPNVRGYAEDDRSSHLGTLDDRKDSHHSRNAGIPSSDHEKLQMHKHVKSILSKKALELAQKAVISEVAKTYAPSAWFADHKHPEKAAMLHVISSQKDADKIVDKVEGELLDMHYKGKPNPTAYFIKENVAHSSQEELNSMAERAATIATAQALRHLGQEVGKPWVDKGIGESAQGQQPGWIKSEVEGGRDQDDEQAHNGVSHEDDATSTSSSSSHEHGGQHSHDHRGLHLPGLGGAKDLSSAAKALAALTAKAKSHESNHKRVSNGDDVDLGMREPRHTLHSRLSREHGGNDGEVHTLHASMQRRHQQAASQSDGTASQSGGNRFSLSVDDDDDHTVQSKSPRKTSSDDDDDDDDDDKDDDSHVKWVKEHTGGTVPVKQSIPSYLSKSNQDWMNAAGAWGTGA